MATRSSSAWVALNSMRFMGVVPGAGPQGKRAVRNGRVLRRGCAYAAVAAEDGPPGGRSRRARAERGDVCMRFARPAEGRSRRGGSSCSRISGIIRSEAGASGHGFRFAESFACAPRSGRFEPAFAGCGSCAVPLPSLLLRGLQKDRPASDLAGFVPLTLQGPAVPRGRPLAYRTKDAARCACARFGHNYKRMNELSKDAGAPLTVGEESAGQRIDNFLLRVLKGVPKSHVYRILRSGEVRLNRGRVGPDARLALGDVVRIPPLRMSRPARPRTVARAFRPEVLYEDDAIIAVD